MVYSREIVLLRSPAILKNGQNSHESLAKISFACEISSPRKCLHLKICTFTKVSWIIFRQGALLQLTKCLAFDLGEFKIRVNAVCPGYIHTEATERVYENQYASLMSREVWILLGKFNPNLFQHGLP